MKINLAVVFGGKSVEHEVSVISAVQAMYSLSEEKYNVIPLYMTKKNEFYTGEALKDIDEFKNIPSLLSKCKRVVFTNNNEETFIEYYPSKKFGSNVASRIDVVLPIVHGTNVEDGCLQGFFETLGVPYAGCDVISSAIGMDKYVMKVMLKEAGVSVLPGFCFNVKDYIRDADEILSGIELEIGYPVIIKPVNLGSSIGIKVARDRVALEDALDYASKYSERILAERAILNLREINCSVLGDYVTARASVCEEPITGGEILSFGDKYQGGTKGMSSAERRLPADLTDGERESIEALAVKTFKALNCAGVARIDCMIDKDSGEIFVNEINTIPGSLSFYLWEPSGIPYSELLGEMIDLALKRSRERKRLSFSHDTNLLSANALSRLKGAKGVKKST